MDKNLIEKLAAESKWELFLPQPDPHYLRYIKGEIFFDIWPTTGTVRIRNRYNALHDSIHYRENTPEKLEILFKELRLPK